MTLTEALDGLAVYGFVRVHKSYSVPIPKIQKIEKKHLIVAGVRIPFSSFYQKYIFSNINR